MRRLISSKRCFLLVAVFYWCGVSLRASDPAIIVDEELHSTFRTKLIESLDTGHCVPASQVSRQLEEEKNGPVLVTSSPLPARFNEPGKLYSHISSVTIIVGNLYKCDKCDEWHGSTAGGVVIGEDGIVATNYHVIESKGAAVFGAMDLNGNLFPVAEVLASSKKDDLAILRLKNCDLKAAHLGDSAAPGNTVHIVSHPDNFFFSYSTGHVSRYYKKKNSSSMRMQVTAGFAKGSSGCGVFDDNGTLIGMAASTNSIYHEKKKGDDRDLQMVVKSCVPISALKKLVQAK